MTYKKIFAAGFVVVLAGLVCAVVVFFRSCLPRRGDRMVEVWETANQTFRVRVREYNESKPIVLPHYYYTFETAVVGSDDWREIATVRTDDDVAIPRDQVRFLNNEFGYLFMRNIYAVTTNGGRRWSVWDAEKDYGRHVSIKDIQLGADGVGVMTLNTLPSQQRELPQLHTKDYGQHWEAN